jgi:antitoxin ParD1/3/4
MPTSIALNSYFENFVRQQVDSGRFNNVSEVVRAGLRLLEQHEAGVQRELESLRADVNAGLASGTALDAEDVLNRLEQKYQKRPADKAMR